MQQKPVGKKTTKPKLGGEIGRPPFDKNSPVTYLPGRKPTNVPATKKPKAKNGSSLGMKSVKSGYDDNSGVTRADFVAIGKGTAKSGAKMKMGGKMAKQAAVAIAMKKAGKTPKKAMNGYGGKAASMVPMKKGGTMKKAMMGNTMMKMGGKMKTCKGGC